MELGEIVLNVVFYIFAIMAVVGALGVALSKNIVRSAFMLLAVLFATAAFYAIMKADFIAAAQILIYVGGILILIIFAIMLTHRITDVKLSNESTPGPVPLLACLAIFIVLVGIVVSYREGWKRITVGIKDEQLAAKYRKAGRDIEAKIAEVRKKAWQRGEVDTEKPAKKPKTLERDNLTKILAVGLMTKFLLPFEVISVLLLAALIGAALLARKEVRPGGDQ